MLQAPNQGQPSSQIPLTPQTKKAFGLWVAHQSSLSLFQSIYIITQIGNLHKLLNLVSASQRPDILQAQNSKEVEESLMAALFYNHLCRTLMSRQKMQFSKATAVGERLS